MTKDQKADRDKYMTQASTHLFMASKKMRLDAIGNERLTDIEEHINAALEALQKAKQIEQADQ